MARTTTHHQIIVRQGPHGVARAERVCGEAITPGHLLEVDSSEHYIKHDGAEEFLPRKIVALETLTPDTITYPTTAMIDIPYASGDTVYAGIVGPGDRAYMFLAAGYTAVEGVSQLCSAGDGTLHVNDSVSDKAVVFGVPAEDKDNSGGTAAVRVLVDVS